MPITVACGARPLDLVVAPCEQRREGRSGHVSTRFVLLGQPEEPRVRLVADDELADAPLLDGVDHLAGPPAEGLRVVLRRDLRVERERDPHAGALGDGRGALEERQLFDDLRFRRGSTRASSDSASGRRRTGRRRTPPRRRPRTSTRRPRRRRRWTAPHAGWPKQTPTERCRRAQGSRAAAQGFTSASREAHRIPNLP